MFCDDQVIGMIEIDADATWAPANEGVVEDLFFALQECAGELDSIGNVQ